MPDIDPAALSRSDSISSAFPGTLSLKQPNGTSAPPSHKAIKTVNTAQRIDLEPYYTSLKAAIGENFAKYKEAICLFILGDYDLMYYSCRHCKNVADRIVLVQAISTKTNCPSKSTVS